MVLELFVGGCESRLIDSKVDTEGSGTDPVHDDTVESLVIEEIDC